VQIDPLLPCYCNALRQASRVVTSFYDDAFRPLGLRVSQYSMLQVIRSEPGITTGAIGLVLDSDQTTASRALATLLRQGWVVSEGGQDRREKCWTLTAKGEALLREARAIWVRAQRAVEKKLGADTIAQLQDVTSGVVHSLARI
jgi:DNA-binding MarR family transcriptional regulator